METATIEPDTTEQQHDDPAAESPAPEPTSGAGPAAAYEKLKWDGDDEDGAYANNTAGMIGGELPFAWYVDKAEDGTGFAVTADDDLAAKVPMPAVPFPTKDKAKAWCEARNAELVKALAGGGVQKTGEIVNETVNEAETTPTGPAAKPKVGSDGAVVRLNTVDPEMWAEITAARDAEANAENDVATIAEDLKAAKKRHEAASERLGRLIDDARRGQGKLFSAATEAKAPVAKVDAGTPLLNWIEVDGSPGCYFAANTRGLLAGHDDSVAVWRIKPSDTGGFEVDCSDQRVLPLPDDTFPDVASAQAWCEQREAEAVAALRNPPAEPVVDDSWRNDPTSILATLGLPVSAVNKLVEAGLVTVGQVEDWRGQDCADPKVRGFAGHGTETRKKLDDAVYNFWKARGVKNSDAAAIVREADEQLAEVKAANSSNSSNGSPANSPESPDSSAPRVYPPAYVGLPPLGVAAKCHSGLLTPMQLGKVPTLRDVVTRDHDYYVVTPAPVEVGSDKYAMRRLLDVIHSQEDLSNEGWKAPEDDSYAGGVVLFSGAKYRIGPVSDAIFIDDPQESPAADGTQAGAA